MRIVLAPKETDPIDGFNEDLFARKPFAQALTNLVINAEDSLVICLDGRWGEGKTTFVKKWQGILNEREVPNLYIDAFKHDYTDDAFTVVAGAILNYIKEFTTPATQENFIGRASKVASKILPLAGKIAAKAVVLGALNDQNIDELADAIKDEAGDISETVIREKLKSYNGDVQSIEHFQSLLCELPSRIGKPASNITVVIDELDRCRPSFAIDLLEKVKHLFSVPGIAFVLVTNKKQLEASIKTRYGESIDASAYLQKFITIDAQLPKRSNVYESDLKVYSQYLAQAHGFSRDDHDDVASVAHSIGNYHNATLRDLERIFTLLAITYSTFEGRQSANGCLAVFCASLKVLKPDLFYLFASKKISTDDLITEYTTPRTSIDSVLATTLQWVRMCYCDDPEFENLRRNPNYQQISQYVGGNRFHAIQRYLIPMMLLS